MKSSLSLFLSAVMMMGITQGASSGKEQGDADAEQMREAVVQSKGESYAAKMASAGDAGEERRKSAGSRRFVRCTDAGRWRLGRIPN